MPATTRPPPCAPLPATVLRAAGVWLASLAAAGCFVVVEPGEVVETPSVSGTLRDGGAALPAVELRIASVHGGGCESPAISTRTGDDGTFAFPETRTQRTFEVVPLAPSTPAYTVQVCVDRGAGPEPVYLETFRGWLPLQVSLDCDLARSSPGRQACEAALAGRQTPGYQGIN